MKFSPSGLLQKVQTSFKGVVGSLKNTGNGSVDLLRRLPDWQKGIVAVVLSVAVVSGGAFGIQFATNEEFRNGVMGVARPSDDLGLSQDLEAELSWRFDELQKTLRRVTPVDTVATTISFFDLPIYPESWVKAIFTFDEQQNQLVWGPDADPDGDGLSNKQEFLYGSDPKAKYTFCINVSDPDCKNKTDKDLINEGISPLTGEEIYTPTEIFIQRQDYNIIYKIQDSFETASKEGVNFPELFQLSKTIDLTAEYDKVPVNLVEDNRDSFLTYNQFRITILEDFVQNGEVSGFLAIYTAKTDTEINALVKKYQDQLKQLVETAAPKAYEGLHRAYIFLYQKLVKLVELRSKLITQIQATEEEKELSRKYAIEVVWAYRKINEEIKKGPQV